MGCLWLVFVVSFLICFKSLCWEGVEGSLQVCVGLFVPFIQVLAGLLWLSSLDASAQDLPEFHVLGFEAHLRCRILSYLVILSRDMRESSTFWLKKILDVAGFTMGCSIIGNSAACKFLMKRELLTNCCRWPLEPGQAVWISIPGDPCGMWVFIPAGTPRGARINFVLAEEYQSGIMYAVGRDEVFIGAAMQDERGFWSCDL